jgi:hypothetical protein
LRVPLTYLILHNRSGHPYEHKKAAINYLYNQIEQYKIIKENKAKEEATIYQILKKQWISHTISKNKENSSSI